MLEFTFAVRFTRTLTQFEGFLSLGFIHIRIAFGLLRTIVKASEARSQITQRKYILDETKRRSLQPQNHTQKPPGWTELSGSPEKPRDPTKKRIGPTAAPTPPMEATFVHDFFGSQLVIGDIRIGHSLARKKHRLEITKNQLLIDNNPQDVNQGDLERIKALIREMRT